MKNLLAVALVPVVAVLTAGCMGSSSANPAASSESPQPPSSGTASTGEASTWVGPCRATTVHYRIALRAGTIGVHGPIPWIVTTPARITGFLFYYGIPPFHAEHPGRATITVHGRVGSTGSTKILWWVRGHPGSALLISGRRLDQPGQFRQQFPGALGSPGFPSIVDVPHSGCWELRIQSGAVSGSVRFRATAAATTAG